MTALQEFIVVFILIGNLLNHHSISSGRPAVEVASVVEASGKPFPFEKPLTKFAIGTLTSMLLEKMLYLDKKDNPQCALSIQNKLTMCRFVNPYLYIVHGGNPMPVPIKIGTNSSEETTLEAVKPNGATSGLLFYEIEYLQLHLMIFWKIQGYQVGKVYTPNRFSVDITTDFFDNEDWLNEKYEVIKTISEKMEGPNEHFEVEREILEDPKRPTVPAFKITIQAQMTMGKKAEFVVELKDNLPVPTVTTEVQPYKRDVIGTAIALAVIPLGINLAFKKIMSYIPSEQSCTISLENLCKTESLIKPSWYITAGETGNIVPWEIKSEEVGQTSFVIPLGGTRIKQTLERTVYFLSYHINGTEYDLVIGTWFPLKLETKEDSENTRETARYTVLILKPPATKPMKGILKTLGDLLSKYSDNPGKLNDELVLKEATIYAAIPMTNLKNKKIQVIQTMKFQKYFEWHYPLIDKPVGSTMQSREYHIKIVTGMGLGQATGMVVKVEVVPGSSPVRFANKNPQAYTEPLETRNAESQFPEYESRIL